ncbi:MAG: hypothetical protein ACK40A_17070, partial [Pannonibacter indicus]
HLGLLSRDCDRRLGSFCISEQHDQSQHAPENDHRPRGDAPAGLLYVFVHENPCLWERHKALASNMASLRHDI